MATPELPTFLELRKKHKTLLLVDEAHSLGTLGRPAGPLRALGVARSDVDLWMGTLSKSAGSCGGTSPVDQLVEYSSTPPGSSTAWASLRPAPAAALAALTSSTAEPRGAWTGWRVGDAVPETGQGGRPGYRSAAGTPWSRSSSEARSRPYACHALVRTAASMSTRFCPRQCPTAPPACASHNHESQRGANPHHRQRRGDELAKLSETECAPIHDEPALTRNRSRKLTKRYGDLLAVNEISFNVRKGEVFACWARTGRQDHDRRDHRYNPHAHVGKVSLLG